MLKFCKNIFLTSTEICQSFNKKENVTSDFSERELLYKVLFDMKRDINDLKKLVVDIIKTGEVSDDMQHYPIIQQLYKDVEGRMDYDQNNDNNPMEGFYTPEIIDESLSLQKKKSTL